MKRLLALSIGRHFHLRASAAFCAVIWACHSPATAASHEPSDSFAYVLLLEGRQDVSMDGSSDDVTLARALRSGVEGLLYLRSEGVAYVTRDPRMLMEARSIVEPQQALGRRQAELGRRQAALGQRQAALGQHQAVLGQQQARVGAEQARVGLEQANAPSQRGEEIERWLTTLRQQQVELARQQAELERQQETMREQQGPFRDQQAEYLREQARLGRMAEGQFRALVSQALKRGVARRGDRN